MSVKLRLYKIETRQFKREGHGNAVSLPQLIVGTWQCRFLMVRLRSTTAIGNVNSDATGFDIDCDLWHNKLRSVSHKYSKN
jgi:hypothetical protein